MKHSSVRDLLSLVVVVAQLFVISGCMNANQAAEADKYVGAMDKRMKQIEKDAAKVNWTRDSESSNSRDE